jgi:hypothetical protein
VWGVVHVIKKIGLATKFKEQVDVIDALKINWEIAKDKYSKCKKDRKAKKDDDSNPAVAAAKAVLDKAWKAWDAVETRLK